MHIPKTGGGTLNTIIKKQYEEIEVISNGGFWGDKPPWKNHFSKDKIEKLQCIRGHFPFGIHEQFAKPFTYLTMMRNPVERMISLYYHVTTSPNNRMYHRAKNLSMKQFMEREAFKIQTVNMQTRQLSGGKTVNLQLAKENLNNYFSVVGITERYNESIFLMSQELGWTNFNINFQKKHVNPYRLKRDEIPQEVIDIIMKNNKLDMEIYEYANEQFNKRILNLDSQSKEKLKNFSLF